jgi:hypothetical protein
MDFSMDFWLFWMCFINCLYKVVTNLKTADNVSKPLPKLSLWLSSLVHTSLCCTHKVLTYVDYRTVSGVFQNIDPPPTPLSTQRVCPPPAPKAGGTHSPGGEGGGGVNILEDASHRIGLLQYNLSTPRPICRKKVFFYHLVVLVILPSLDSPIWAVLADRRRSAGGMRRPPERAATKTLWNRLLFMWFLYSASLDTKLRDLLMSSLSYQKIVNTVERDPPRTNFVKKNYCKHCKHC